MQQEDDLRALAKIMDFLRAVSIILVVMNVYWYCYATVEGHGINIINEKITWSRIWAVLGAGFVFYFIINWWMLLLPIHADVVTALYILTIAIGYICLMMAGLWMSRLLKYHLMEDVFNNENESFQQETRLMENEYSVNLPTRFYYKKKWNRGWINVVNPFRRGEQLHQAAD